MIINKENFDFVEFTKTPINTSWNYDTQKELKMHRIHSYPAKFPSFIVTKALDYAQKRNKEINLIADIFCGCGTTALESRLNNKKFWGCDINPVATLIAKVKSEKYNEKILNKYFSIIINNFNSDDINNRLNQIDDTRIKYWFEKSQITELNKLIKIINEFIPKGKYRNFFLCAFSNILKKTSRWLAASIKPQIDPNKNIVDVLEVFTKQFLSMKKANQEIKVNYNYNNKPKIKNLDFLNLNIKKPFIDMLITSPPYVTSYEYADLHQLSTLWLGYTKDYRTFRSGSIGSLYNKSISKKKIQSLNQIGKKIYNKLMKADRNKAKAVAKYFLDINTCVNKSFDLLKKDGLCFFIIGDTEYKNISIENSKYLAKCMLDIGFISMHVLKRKVSSKNLTPYRDKLGRFSKKSNKKKIYNHEFILIGEK